MAEWFESLFSGLYSQVLPNAFKPEQTARQAATLRKLLGLRRGMRVLDVPCGQGRLTLPLAKCGLNMTGVDLCEKYIRTARRQAKREGIDARFMRCDMRRIEFDGEFHAAFNWFGSFGYFSDEENQDFLARAFRALRPGGRFAVEGTNKTWLLKHWRARDEGTVGGVHVTHRRTWSEKTQRITDQWRMSKGDRAETYRIVMRVFDGADIRAMLTRAGFRDIRLYDNRTLGRFTRHSQRCIAIARKFS